MTDLDTLRDAAASDRAWNLILYEEKEFKMRLLSTINYIEEYRISLEG